MARRRSRRAPMRNLSSRASRPSRAPGRTTSPTWTTRPTARRFGDHGRGACPGLAALRREGPGRQRRARHAAALSRLRPGPGAALPVRHAARTRPSPRPASRPGSFVHPTARLEHGVTVDPGAVIGPEAEIGAGTLVGAHAVIGAEVRIGRDCSIGAERHRLACACSATGSSSIRACASARTVSASPWARKGHLKVPQIGRVIIQDDVEIGANTHDRPRRQPRHGDRRGHQDRQPGADRPQRGDRPPLRDRRAGRHRRLDARSRISWRSAARSAVNGHVRIGMGAQIAGDQRRQRRCAARARAGAAFPARPDAGVVPRDQRAEKTCVEIAIPAIPRSSGRACLRMP